MKTLSVALTASEWQEVASGTAAVILRRKRSSGVRIHVGTTVPDLNTNDYVMIDRDSSDEITFTTLGASDKVFARADQPTDGIVELTILYADTTAPVLSNVAATKLGHNGGTGVFDTTEGAGKHHWILSLAADAVTAQQIKDGHMHDNTAAAASGVADATAGTTQSISFVDLEPEQTYYFRVVQVDRWGNTSNVGAAAVSFTTDAAPPTP